jgi:hypothetical protein
MIPVFQYNNQAYGGTEYMARGFHKLIAYSLPKLKEYNSIIMPGVIGKFEYLASSPEQSIIWMHNTPIQFGEEFVNSFKSSGVANNIKYIIAISEFSKQEIIRQLGIKPEQVYVIENAIDPLVYDKSKFDNQNIFLQMHYNFEQSQMGLMLDYIVALHEFPPQNL